jgi:hypothetical protein
MVITMKKTRYPEWSWLLLALAMLGFVAAAPDGSRTTPAQRGRG